MKYNRIKAVLANKGITNRKLATGLGVSETAVSQWVTNSTQPSIGTLFKIANFVGCDVRELLVSNRKIDDSATDALEIIKRLIGHCRP